MMRRQARLTALAASLWLFAGAAWANGLQVSPLSLTIKTPLTAEALQLKDAGQAPMHVQIRVFQWTQVAGKDKLTPSRRLVVSPPMVVLKPNQWQLVRVIRAGPPPVGHGAVESSFRVVVSELPVNTPKAPGLHFVFAFRLPVFVRPKGAGTLAPKLHWSLETNGGKAVLTITNDGNVHARLTKVSFTGRNGRHIVVNKGLFGYVLPGSYRKWTLESSASMFAEGGSFTANVNGKAVTEVVAASGGSD